MTKTETRQVQNPDDPEGPLLTETYEVEACPKSEQIKAILSCQSEYANVISKPHVITNSKKFNMETGTLDARQTTFRIVEVTNNLEPISEEQRAEGQTDVVRYYLT